ncbi:SAP30-binding protein-like [Rhodnius prolixus]|uniref:Putative transcriptional regulator n=2 Tax=Rhodnius TaxID=13248 RepID=R4G3D1_RHOPR
MASLALAALTEIYTDSEDDESHRDIHEKSFSKQMSIESKTNNKIGSKSVVSVTSENLVSTQIISDEEPSIEVFNDVELPQEPVGRCSIELQEKIATLTEKMKVKSVDMNQIIQERKSFRNPSIYEKLIQFCDINEFGTNYDAQIYDPLKWDKSSYYDSLAKAQKADMDQREKERKERTKVEFLIGTAKKATNGSSTEEELKKRKSKWDQKSSSVQSTVTQPAGIVTLTSSATGTKGTVISAFGTLPKKTKM